MRRYRHALKIRPTSGRRVVAFIGPVKHDQFFLIKTNGDKERCEIYSQVWSVR
jgi:hypothetical protein